MQTIDILKDIGKRCNGDIYLGVVGPVRVGKSSFIKRFMEMAVIHILKIQMQRYVQQMNFPNQAKVK